MTLEVSVNEAGADLTRLLGRALAGDDVIIMKEGRHLARLQPIGGESAPRIARARRKPGTAKCLVLAGPDFDEPLPDDVIAEFEK